MAANQTAPQEEKGGSGRHIADREVRRRLAAILAADVAGYTRRMEADSDRTVAAWQDAREDVIKPQVGEFSGKTVKLTGDGFLVEFATVQDAVNCAIAMQSGLESSSLDFRFGVNFGDIIDDGEDIHGEGVNVAARLEGLPSVRAERMDRFVEGLRIAGLPES